MAAFLYHHLLLPFLFLCIIISAESADPTGQYCNEKTTLNATTQTSRNIDTLLAKLVESASQTGFSATSYGTGNQVYGLAQCRGDVSTKECSSCIRDAAREIRIRCPNQADARIWYEYCFLRYNTEDFRGEVDTGFGIFSWNVENVTDPTAFNENLGGLMYQIDTLATEPASKGLGTGESKVSPSVTLYALVQCTRDLSALSCGQCLAVAISNLPTYCENKQGCRILYSSCYVRYEQYPFFFPLESQPDSSSLGKYMSIILKP